MGLRYVLQFWLSENHKIAYNPTITKVIEISSFLEGQGKKNGSPVKIRTTDKRYYYSILEAGKKKNKPDKRYFNAISREKIKTQYCRPDKKKQARQTVF